MKQATATVGPYRGMVITFQNDAEADQAVADKWATMQNEPPYDLAVPPSDYPELSDTEHTAAEQAARAWFEAFNAPPESKRN